MNALDRTGAQAARYAAVGVANTVLGLGLIWGLMWLGAAPVPANVAGYAAGLTLSFFLNRAWTFRARPDRRQAVRYLLAFAVAYALNLAALGLGLRLLGGEGYLAQAAAMVVYSGVFFLLCRGYVFGGEATARS